MKKELDIYITDHMYFRSTISFPVRKEAFQIKE